MIRGIGASLPALSTGERTVCDELGIEAILPASTSAADADVFARHWLDPLPDYDRDRGTALVATLTVYLDHVGNSHWRAPRS
jgi:DNA-binding PucR family transcriptional regulator